MKAFALSALLLMMSWVSATAAQVIVHGRVINPDSVALSGARIEVADSLGRRRYNTISDSLGAFVVRIAAPIVNNRFRVQSEMIGYRTTTSVLDVQDGQSVEIALTMAVAAIPIQPLRVMARQRYTRGLLDEYFDRADHVRRFGGGTIIGYDELQRRAGSTVNMIIAEHSPARGCPPAFFIDGMRATMDDLRMTSATVVEGIEIYRTPAQVPAQYQNRASCGAILIWTQIGDRGEGRPLTWRRVLITLGLIAGGFMILR